MFFRDGYHDGIIAAARCKKEMSRFQIYERGFDIRPHVMTAYDTAVKMVHADMELDGSREYTADFELGPWTRESHTEILATAGLEEPVPMNHPPATGEPLPAPDGVV
ncbi:MAG TPA: hypothetical protein DIT99_00125, partial [Candidatus Latescibacteria bacterium]|nr:hypothetical protein [Candidatus Latescibacterota bacterium]